MITFSFYNLTIKPNMNFFFSSSMKFLIVTCLFSFFAFTGSASAQLLSVKDSNSQQISFQENSKNDWTVYCDHENRVIYVDFEKINTNLSSVIVRDNQGKIVFKDENLWQLPVNSIYEVDCLRYNTGEYTLELKSFTSSINKGFSVK